MDEIKIGSAVAAKPGMTKGMLRTGALPDGTPMEIPVVIVRGETDGPTLWLNGCVHGNEYCSTFAIHELLRTLDWRQLSGSVVALPILNITAFRQGQRMSPFEGMSGGDLNRCFPGKADGGLTSQMAFAIYEELRRYADYLVDFHTAMTKSTRWVLFPRVEGAVGEGSEGLARAFGFNALPTPLDIFGGLLAGSSMMCAARDGIPGMIIEMGGKGAAFDADMARDGAERLRNVMRHLKMLQGALTDYSPQSFFGEFAWIYATQGGLFQPAVDCGDMVEEGDVIGHYYTAHGEPAGEARSPRAGLVNAIHGGPLMATGETLIHIGVDPRPA